MATVPLFTYRDAVRHVIDFMGASVTEVSKRDARRAVRNAYRTVTTAHSWSYGYALGRLTTVANYNTGTITVDHTGGTYEREVTLASGTWPSWAAYGTLVIDNVSYQVATRESNSVITLSPNSNPGADVAAGTSYELYRDTYPLPSDFSSMGTFVETSNQAAPNYVHINDWVGLQRLSKSPSVPRCFTICQDPNYMNTMAWRCHPPPDNIYSYDYAYKRRFRPLVYDEYSTGTVTATADSAVLAGSSTAWSSAYVGSVIRLSADGTNAPESLEWQNPYSVERVITAYTSATSITVDTAFTSTLTAVKYVISDPVDLEDGAMLNLFLRACEKEVATAKTMRTKQEAAMAYTEALIAAREADSRNFAPQAEGMGGNGRLPLRSMPMEF